MTTEQRISYRPNELAAATGLSRDLIFKAIRDGRLRSLRVGAARVITAAAVRDFLEQLEREQAGAA